MVIIPERLDQSHCYPIHAMGFYVNAVKRVECKDLTRYSGGVSGSPRIVFWARYYTGNNMFDAIDESGSLKDGWLPVTQGHG